MALSDEQNAMLRLLAQGEQGYDDIAALMGLSAGEVRAKVVGALAQLEAEGKPTPDVPPPLPGGAKPAAEVVSPGPEPISEPPAEEELPAEPGVADAMASEAPVESIAADPAPPNAAATPAAPKPQAIEPKPVATSASPPRFGPSSSGRRTVTLPSGRDAWILGGGILAAIAAIVVAIVVASGGGGGSSTASTGGASTAAEEGKAENTAVSKTVTQAELKAMDGSSAAGLATFGRVKNKLALQIEATGLEPTTAGTDAYTIWLAQSPRKMLPLASTAVKGSGKGAGDIAAQFEVPVEVLAYLANGTFDHITITRTETKPLEAALSAATQKKTIPVYTGKAVLSGAITGPIVGLAKREEEQKAEEKGE